MKYILLHVNQLSTLIHGAEFGYSFIELYCCFKRGVGQLRDCGSHLELTPEYISLVTNEKTSLQYVLAMYRLRLLAEVLVLSVGPQVEELRRSIETPAESRISATGTTLPVSHNHYLTKIWEHCRTELFVFDKISNNLHLKPCRENK